MLMRLFRASYVNSLSRRPDLEHNVEPDSYGCERWEGKDGLNALQLWICIFISLRYVNLCNLIKSHMNNLTLDPYPRSPLNQSLEA